MTTLFLYPLILFAGVLQAMGPPMNGQLRVSLTNPWLANLVSFGLVLAVLIVIAAIFPRPLPTGAGVASMPWWAPLGGLIGAVAVVVGLLFVDRVGAGALAALTISANLIMSIVIDKYGLLNMPVHALSIWRMIGGLLMVVGVGLIAWF
ncbi:MAG: DMT family transporter [Acetobacteraceae bacterium]